jgi:hypothetical protein
MTAALTLSSDRSIVGELGTGTPFAPDASVAAKLTVPIPDRRSNNDAHSGLRMSIGLIASQPLTL